MGDYISREELYKQISSAYITAERFGFELGKDVVLLAIKQQPAADVAPVRHGRWQNPEDAECYQCSVCGKYRNQEYGLELPIFDKFCSNCGARMDLPETPEEETK